MFVMRVSKHKNGKRHVYWALAESYRTTKGSRHRIVGWLGELQGGARRGWAHLATKLNGRLPAVAQPVLFERGGSSEPVPEEVKVEVGGVRVEGTKDFGNVWLGLVAWEALGLDAVLAKLLPPGHERVPWWLLVKVEVLARLCEPASDLHAAQAWYPKTALPELLGVPAEEVYAERLYRTLDVLLGHKDAVERQLAERLGALFGSEREVCLYDVTSSYFEGEAGEDPLAQRGYSREGRGDCKQVCLGLVVGADGMPRGHEVFAGNRLDRSTLADRVEHMEACYGPAHRLWVFDRGIADERNLAYLRERGAVYLAGTPRPLLRRFEAELSDPAGWKQLPNGVAVKLLPDRDDGDTYVLCRSPQRAAKEHAIHERFAARIEARLLRLKARLAGAKTRPDRTRVERQLGRLLQRNSRAAGKFRLRLDDDPARAGHLCLSWTTDPAWTAWAAASEGAYLLRTCTAGREPETLWRAYMDLSAVEDLFRTLKSDLLLRPIRHQIEPRVRGHIFVTYLALVLWKTLERFTEAAGLGKAVRTVLDETARIKLCEVILPTSTGRELRLLCISRPDPGQRALLDRLGIEIPARLGQPRWRNVIEA